MLFTAVMADPAQVAEDKIRADIASMLDSYDYSGAINAAVVEEASVEDLLLQLQQKIGGHQDGLLTDADAVTFTFDLNTGEITTQTVDAEGNIESSSTYTKPEAKVVTDAPETIVDATEEIVQ